MPAAILLIAIVAVAMAFLPSAGIVAKYIPILVFCVIILILGINLLRVVFGILFGKNAADTMTGRLLYDIVSPIFKIIGKLFRTVFRIH
jgi:xanthine/uracil permease